MELPDAITEGLPAPHDDEPATLRQDLLDEVNDHLQSALKRELRATPDPAQAWRNVLARFGDPGKVLYQLWYQAMKEQIMSQRVMLILGGIMVAACLSALGMTWWLVLQSRDTQKALLDKIAALGPLQAAGPTPSAEWRPVRFLLTMDDGKDSPADAPFTLYVKGRLFGDREDNIEVQGDGNYDLGLLRVGSHEWKVISPTGEQAWSEFRLRPLRDQSAKGKSDPEISEIDATIGDEGIVRIRCPVPIPDTNLAFDIAWPEGLRDEGLSLVYLLQAEPRKATDFHVGNSVLAGSTWSPISRIIALDARGRVLAMTYEVDDLPFQFLRYGYGAAELANVDRGVSRKSHQPLPPTPQDEREMLADLLRSRFEPPQGEVQIPATKYTIRAMAVFKPGAGDSAEARRDSAIMLAVAPYAWRSNYGEIDPTVGEPNRFTIRLPDSLVAQVRKSVAEQAKP